MSLFWIELFDVHCRVVSVEIKVDKAVDPCASHSDRVKQAKSAFLLFLFQPWVSKLGAYSCTAWKLLAVK